MAVLIEISAAGRAYWFFGGFLQRWQQRFLRPLFFSRRGVPPVKHISNRFFSDWRLGRFLIRHVDRACLDHRRGWCGGQGTSPTLWDGHSCPPLLKPDSWLGSQCGWIRSEERRV